MPFDTLSKKSYRWQSGVLAGGCVTTVTNAVTFLRIWHDTGAWRPTALIGMPGSVGCKLPESHPMNLGIAA